MPALFISGIVLYLVGRWLERRERHRREEDELAEAYRRLWR